MNWYKKAQVNAYHGSENAIEVFDVEYSGSGKGYDQEGDRKSVV